MIQSSGIARFPFEARTNLCAVDRRTSDHSANRPGFFEELSHAGEPIQTESGPVGRRQCGFGDQSLHIRSFPTECDQALLAAKRTHLCPGTKLPAAAGAQTRRSCTDATTHFQRLVMELSIFVYLIDRHNITDVFQWVPRIRPWRLTSIAARTYGERQAAAQKPLQPVNLLDQTIGRFSPPPRSAASRIALVTDE
jgi:hypothetical protein